MSRRHRRAEPGFSAARNDRGARPHAAALERRLVQAGNGAGAKPRLLTIDQAAAYLGRSERAIRRCEHPEQIGTCPSLLGGRR
jgi:hypothetical protein